LRDGGRARTEPAHRRALEDPDPALEEHPPESAGQPGGLDRRALAQERPPPEDRRVADRPDFLAGELDELVLDAEPAKLRHGRSPPLLLRRGGGHLQLAGGREPRVDPVTLAERADGLDAATGGEAELHRVGVAEPPCHLADPAPPTVHEPAVSPARPPAAHVLLEQDHVDPGVALLQEVGAPHARVPAAQDHHVCREVGRKRRAGRAGELGLRERLLHPPAPGNARWNGHRHGVHAGLPGIVRFPIVTHHPGRSLVSSDTSRPRSRQVTEGPERAPARAMLRAVGFSEEDFDKAQVGVASSWNEVTPCNYHLDKLAALAKEGVRQGGAVPIEFTTIAVSDGIAMGHEGMKASLVSRDVIADSVELVMHAERFDGLVGIAGCDKSEPGMLMAMARLNLPSVYLYGGTILPGTYRGRDVTIQDVFEAVGAHAKGAMSDEELLAVE